jgi:hypothetical protein
LLPIPLESAPKFYGGTPRARVGSDIGAVGAIVDTITETDPRKFASAYVDPRTHTS